MKKLLVILLAVIMVAVLAACGDTESTQDLETNEIVEYETDTEEVAEEEVIDYIEHNANSVLFEGLYFEIGDTFTVETITELTQYHLSEEERYNTDVDFGAIYMREYHMNEPVLFIPITITTIETYGDSEYRFRPELRVWTPSGRRSGFEADTLNGKQFFQMPTFNEIPNYERAIVHGYLAFNWEGYGEYRLEIIWSNEVGAEFTFNVNSDNVVLNLTEVDEHDMRDTQEQSQNELDEHTMSLISGAMVLIEGSFAEAGFEMSYTVDHDLSGVIINMWRGGLFNAFNDDEDGWEELQEILVSLYDNWARIIEMLTGDADVGLLQVIVLNDLNMEDSLLIISDGIVTFDAFN